MVVKFLCSIILSLGGALAIANIEKIKINVGTKELLSILILSMCTFFFIKVEFSVLQSMLIFVLMILVYKSIFKYDIQKAVIMTSTIMLLVLIADASGSLIAINFVSKELFRTNYLYLIAGNLYIVIVIFLLTKVKIISYKINVFVNKAYQNQVFTTIVEVLISVIVLFLISYNFYDNFNLDFDYITNLLIFILVIVVLVIYINDANKYTKLLEEYDKLLDYVQTFEEWIEEEQIELHESKNSLSTIYEMNNIRDVKKEIDKILNRKNNIEDSWVIDLKPIPKGGLKGLLYYKFMISKNKKINLITDVSANATSKFKTLNKEDYKLLFRLIGIYFDNAIEASVESKEKNISFEVYRIDKKLNIVITNTYNGHINLKQIGERGITTKGEKRGKGTYLAKKLVTKNERFIIKNSVLNNYYIQKIIIK